MTFKDQEDFLRGKSDCSWGIPHKAGQGEYYDRGYSAQYESEQIVTELGLVNEDQ